MRALLTISGMMVSLVAIQAQAQTSASAYTTGYRYDLEGKQTGIIKPDPDGAGAILFAATRNTYDAAGRLIKVETGQLASWQSEAVAPSAWTGFTVWRKLETDYDGLDRKIKEKDTVGTTLIAVTQYSYDVVGRPECTVVRMNSAVFGSLPASACTLGTTGTLGPDRITKNVYDDASQLLKVQKAFGVTTANGFPATLQQDYATYTYTSNGKQQTVADAKGNKATYSYDGFDRLIAWQFPSKTTVGSSATCTIGTVSEVSGITSPSETRAGTDDCEKYAYDRNGNRAKLMKRDGNIIRYSYDPLNQMTLKDIPGTTTGDVYYNYDHRGLQLGARFGSLSGAGIATAYDHFGRITSLTNNTTGTSRTLTYEYDADGNRTKLTFPDTNYFTFVYDGLDRMTDIRESGTTSVTTLSYTNRGWRDLMSGGGLTTTYATDDGGRLTSLQHNLAGTAQDVTYSFTSYNAARQVLGRTISNNNYVWQGQVAVNRNYAVNGLNQYTTAGSAAFCYDLNGNLTHDGATVYKYDVENRLIEARAAVNTSCTINYTGTLKATLAYDTMGGLVQVTGTATTQFLYDGPALVAEYNGTGTLLKRYVHGPGDDQPLIWYEGATLASTGRRQLRTDHQGSIVSISDSVGASIGINSYDEYGIPAATNIGRFAYTGQIMVPELGMYHYKARIYSPTLGRFLQTDPIGYEDQINLYAYVANDPVNRVDPTGKCSSIKDKGVQSQCLEARKAAIENAKDYLESQKVGESNREPAYIETFNEESKTTSTRTGDDAGKRTGNDVNFTNEKGERLVAQPDGRVRNENPDGTKSSTSDIVLVTGHGHPRVSSSRADGASTNRANESINDNKGDQLLNKIAPLVLKTPSGKIKVFVGGRQVE